MQRKRVLVLSNGSLLIASVLGLLRQVEDLELEWVMADDRDVTAKIVRFSPDVVILDAGGPPDGTDLVTRILPEILDARVVALNLQRMDMVIFRTERISNASLECLLEAIRIGRKRSRKRPASRGAGEAGLNGPGDAGRRDLDDWT